MRHVFCPSSRDETPALSNEYYPTPIPDAGQVISYHINIGYTLQESRAVCLLPPQAGYVYSAPVSPSLIISYGFFWPGVLQGRLYGVPFAWHRAFHSIFLAVTAPTRF